MKGASMSLATRRAISVLPTPVGPIIITFLGVISSRISSGTRWRRVRLRSAIAMARLAASCPTMYLSSSATIWRGVRSCIACTSLLNMNCLQGRVGRRRAHGYGLLFCFRLRLYCVNRDVVVGVNAEVGGYPEGRAGYLL